jgi:DGQHR domain-containing protein
MPLALDAIRFEQKSVPMYLVSLPLEYLDFCCIDRWDPHRTGIWKGYQRGLLKSKINNLAEFLERKDGILPVAGLLNVRQKGAIKFFGKKSARPTMGKIMISDYAPLNVVDMQHRLEGIKLAYSKGYLKDFYVPALITEGLSGVDEASQFYIINTRARRMGVDLTRRLLIEHNKIQDIVDVKPWELKAVRIAILLNKQIKKNNPWYDRIREPEVESRQNHVATEKSFVPSLK